MGLTEDVVNFITKYENGQCDDIEIAQGFQLLIDTGVAWQLQGSYGRAAQGLIDQGICTPPRVNNPACPSGQCGLD